jgi:hypothetical protein
VVHLGAVQPAVAEIEYVDMLSEIFPSMAVLYSVQPVGKARVRNTTAGPVTLRLGFYIHGVMNQPTETGLLSFLPGEEREVPFNAVFNSDIDSVRRLTVRDGVVVVGRDDGTDRTEYQTRVVLRGRNEWNGDIAHLKYFVTPQSPGIMRFARESIDQHRERLDSVSTSLGVFIKADILFTQMSRQLFYTRDPQESQEYVQYPLETLSMHGGDCNDFSVAYAALLKSIGVQVAFVDVIPPGHPENSHVYIVFDTGLTSSEAGLLSTNPKKYLLRKNDRGIETVWIPVETTILKGGFDAAWSAGAERFFTDTQLQRGLLEGWVRIEDVESPY